MRATRAPWWRARRDELLELAAQAIAALCVRHRRACARRARDLRDARAERRSLVLRDQGECASRHPARARRGRLRARMRVAGRTRSARAEIADVAVAAVHAELRAARRIRGSARTRTLRVTLDNAAPARSTGREVFAGREIHPAHRSRRRPRPSRQGENRRREFEIRPVARRARRIPRASRARNNVRIGGLHAHLGSGILDVAHWSEVYVQLASLAEKIGSVHTLNIGGGLGVPSRAGRRRARSRRARARARRGEARLSAIRAVGRSRAAISSPTPACCSRA